MTSANYQINPDKFMDRDQRAKLIKATKERAELDMIKGRKTWPVRHALIDLALYSGLRVSEIAALTIGDLRLNAKDPHIMVYGGKGNRTRVVYIDKELARHMRDFLKLKRTYDEPMDEDSPLFCGQGGGKVKAITLQKSFKRALEVAGLPETFSIHAARHTYATFLLADTRNLRYVQKQLGHSAMAMTALYADILPEENGALANMISR